MTIVPTAQGSIDSSKVVVDVNAEVVLALVLLNEATPAGKANKHPPTICFTKLMVNVGIEAVPTPTSFCVVVVAVVPDVVDCRRCC